MWKTDFEFYMKYLKLLMKWFFLCLHIFTELLFIFSRFHGKLFSVLFQATISILSFQKNAKGL